MRNLMIIALICVATVSVAAELQALAKVDLAQYAGTWYEISRFPAAFVDGLVCVTATYTPQPNGEFKVENKGRKGSATGSPSGVAGKAWAVNDGKSKLKVQFFPPFSADYWILDIDPSYKWALIGEPKLQKAWILSRKPTLDEFLYNKLRFRIQLHGYDSHTMIRTRQYCDKNEGNLL